MYKVMLFLGLLTLSLMACNNDKPVVNEDENEHKEAVAEAYGNSDFEITCQANWVWQEVEPNVYVMHSPLKNAKDTFAEKVSLVVNDFGTAMMSLDTFAIATAKNVVVEEHGMSEMKVLENEKIDSGDKPYFKLVYTGKYEGQKLKWRQHLFVEHNKAFILTYVALPSTYDEYWAEGEKTMNSLVIKEPIEEVEEEEEPKEEE